MDPQTPKRQLSLSTSWKLGEYVHMGDVIPLTHIHALKTIQFQKTSCTNWIVQGHENHKHRVQLEKFTTHVNELYNTYHISLR